MASNDGSHPDPESPTHAGSTTGLLTSARKAQRCEAHSRVLMRSTSFLTGVVALLATYATLADDLVSFATGGYAAGLRTMEIMHKMDTDSDHMVSRAEWLAFQNRVFTMLDRKKNDQVDENEYAKETPELVSFATGGYARGLLTQEMFDKIDADRDGTISREEFISYQLKIFDRMDTSPTHKGMLGASEFFATGGRPPS